MGTKKEQNKKGFTIIEVVLVLAIAGLIFMMVFVAWPALQRSQRDTQRKNDVSRVVTAVTNYSSSNNGRIPRTQSDWDLFKGSYLMIEKDSFIDPSGAGGTDSGAESYVFSSNDTLLEGAFNYDNNQNVIYYSVGYICSENGAVEKAGSRRIALRIYLENGGIYCENV